MKARKTGFYVAGTGALVSALGWRLLPKKIGSGLLGFGLAHIALGMLDRLRPALKQ